MAKVKLIQEPEYTGDHSIDTCRYLYRVLIETSKYPLLEELADMLHLSKYGHPNDITDPNDARRMVHVLRVFAKAYEIEN
ncbi:TPA: hypothetical protein ACKPZ6_003836 [Serratia liquefaciens]